MLQSFATFVSLVIAMGAVALIVGVLADDWQTVMRALRNPRLFQPVPLPVQARVTISDRRARVLKVSSQTAPRRAAA